MSKKIFSFLTASLVFSVGLSAVAQVHNFNPGRGHNPPSRPQRPPHYNPNPGHQQSGRVSCVATGTVRSGGYNTISEFEARGVTARAACNEALNQCFLAGGQSCRVTEAPQDNYNPYDPYQPGYPDQGGYPGYPGHTDNPGGVGGGIGNNNCVDEYDSWGNIIDTHCY